MALVHFMGQQQGAQRTYALLTLANKLLSQCEAQVRVGGRGCGWGGQVIVHLGGAFLWGAVWAWACMCLGGCATAPETVAFGAAVPSPWLE